MSLFCIICSTLCLIGVVATGFAIFALLPLFTLALAVLVLWGNRYYIPCFYWPALIAEVNFASVILKKE
jgi:hypothetical protein